MSKSENIRNLDTKDIRFIGKIKKVAKGYMLYYYNHSGIISGPIIGACIEFAKKNKLAFDMITIKKVNKLYKITFTFGNE